MASEQILDEKVVYQNGHFQRVRRWWRGPHPEKGTITRGWTGVETVEERERILPLQTFLVKEG